MGMQPDLHEEDSLLQAKKEKMRLASAAVRAQKRPGQLWGLG